jgi:hypothetical protein
MAIRHKVLAGNANRIIIKCQIGKAARAFGNVVAVGTIWQIVTAEDTIVGCIKAIKSCTIYA